MTEAGDRLATLQTLPEVIRRHGGAQAIVDLGQDRAIDFDALADAAEAQAAAMAAAGWQPGDRVVLIGENGRAWVRTVLALLRAGLVPVPLDPVMPDADLLHALNDSGATRVAVTTRRLSAIRRLTDRLDKAPALFLIDRTADDEDNDPSVACLPAPTTDAPVPAADRDPEDTAVLFYTSGTTGKPKGVPLSHRNIVANLRELTAEGLLPRDLRALIPLPLFHVYPFVVGMLTSLVLGAAIVFPAGLSGPELVGAMRDGRVSALIGVPRLYEALVAAIGRRGGRRAERLLDAAQWLARHVGPAPARWLATPLRRRLAPDLRLAVSGGSALEAETAWRLRGLGLEVLTGYGLTETSPIVAFDRPGTARPGAAGKPLDSLDLRIADPDAEGIGEIVVRGPNVFGGYLGLPDKTAEVLDHDGWFRTGDLGRLDEDGYLHVGARRSALISLGGGQTVVPETVEALLDEQPEIKESAVLAPESRLVALVMSDRDALDGRQPRDAVDAAVRRVRDRMPGDARLSDLALVSAPLPRTPIGKLRRHKLAEIWHAVREEGREPAVELSAEDEALLDNPKAAALWNWLHRRFPDRPLSPGADLQTALGIDSLDWVTLSLELERDQGLRLDEAAWSGMATIRDLLEAAAEGGGIEAAEPAPGPGDLSQADRRWATPPPWPARIAARIALLADRAAFLWPWRLTVEGRDNVPRSGPVILAPNHRSYLDPMAVAAALPAERLVQLWWAGSSQVMARTAPRRWASRILRVLPVEEGRRPGMGLALAEIVLGRGDAVVWFPEGRRAPRGEIMTFQPGIGRLVERTDAPILPVAIEGTGEAWGPDRRWPRPGAVRIRFGAPIGLDDLLPADDMPDDPAERYRAIAAALRQRVADLSDPN